MKATLATILILTSINTNASVIKEAWNSTNNPERMQITRGNRNYTVGKLNYIKDFSKLPTSASLETTPWSGDYWPTHKGGITHRWNTYSWDESETYGYAIMNDDQVKSLSSTEELSPAEKYDLFLGRYDFPLTKYERERTNIMKTIEGSDQYDSNFEIPSWEGLCHAWAPATLGFTNPNPVTLKNKDGLEVKFGSSDVKALLTYFLHYDKTAANFFLGGRCNTDFEELRSQLREGSISEEEYEREINSSKCRDTNAGAFHLVLTNQIGLLNEGFIVDVTRDLEVWNQPVHGFKSRIVKETQGASEGAAKGTVKEIEIRTRMYYTVEIDTQWSMVPADSRSESFKDYHYRVEINRNNEIIGGEWLSSERPDFLWKQTIPNFSGFFAPLEKIYKESIK
ncbi:hypothetical protein [Halobacteriovorax sp. HLS]|uniref:hypothetical protein n=1 Tax=Halobacteriovorax sp. HLS TaxID=2234000 RepID=UPI000FD80617|nr:hypothetical protein [Halobacteriovorax sp. HLS]